MSKQTFNFDEIEQQYKRNQMLLYAYKVELETNNGLLITIINLLKRLRYENI
jgi:hypothetical protein